MEFPKKIKLDDKMKQKMRSYATWLTLSDNPKSAACGDMMDVMLDVIGILEYKVKSLKADIQTIHTLKEKENGAQTKKKHRP